MWPSQNNIASVSNWLNSILTEPDQREKNATIRVLTEAVSNKSRTQLLLNYRFSESELNKLADLAHKLNHGMPVQLAVGFSFFLNHKILVSQHTLIPRPETEELVDLAIKTKPNPSHVIDIGTGSGCIAIALASRWPQAKITAVDVSPEALEMAKKNALSNDVYIEFHQMDITQTKPTQSFDLIVSNPPYIPIKELENMQSQVKNFEPHQALFVPNNDPLIFYREIAKCHLNPKGVLAFECHENYAIDVANLLEPVFQSVSVVTDMQGKNRFVLAVK
ncbi:MAG: peptide chain release factor N(5)-glutamine methyltransferase [Bacteroidota bacterium]